MRAGEAGDGIDEEHHIPADFHQALGAFDAKIGDADVIFDLLVVGGRPDLGGRDAALEIGHFLRPFVHEEDHDVALGIIFQDTQGHVAEQRCLAGAWRSHNQAAGALADRAEQIDGARRHPAVLHFHFQELIGRNRRERSELVPGAAVFKGHSVHRLDETHLRIWKTAIRRKSRAADHGACAQLEAADELLGHEWVRRSAFAAAAQIEQLAIATALQINVEDALDVDGFNRRTGGCGCFGADRGRGRGGRGSVRRSGRRFLFHTKCETMHACA